MRRLTPLLFLPVVVGFILLYSLPVNAKKTGELFIERVSVASDGTQGDRSSYYPAPLLSNDGRYVGFISEATNLVPNDTNQGTDSFLHDRLTNTTTRMSVAADGSELEAIYRSGSEAISEDGRWVLYTHSANGTIPTDTNFAMDAYLRDLQTGEVERISVGFNTDNLNSDIAHATMTPDANLIVYQSGATNVIPNDTNGFMSDIFLYNRSTGTTTLVSTNSTGQQLPQASGYAAISADGTWVVFNVFDNIYESQIYAKNLLTGELRRVSSGFNGSEPNGTTFSKGDISANGRYVAFESGATNLDPTIPNITDKQIYVHDLTTNITKLISIGMDGMAGNGNSYDPVVSGDGRYVAFTSWSSNLVAGDVNIDNDIYIYDTVTGEMERIVIEQNPNQGYDDLKIAPSITDDGRYVAFASYVSDLVMDDTNQAPDVFVYDRLAGATPTPSPTATHTPIPTNTATPTATATPPTQYIYLPLVRRQ